MSWQNTLNLSSVLLGLMKDSPISGKVRIQKSVYFLQWLGMGLLEKVHFRYEEYGPSSFDVFGVMVQMIGSGLIQEDCSNREDEHQNFIYKSNSLHSDFSFLTLKREDSDLLEQVQNITKNSHWRELELVSRVLDLEKHLHLERGYAFSRAVGQNPQGVSFQEGAKSLLEKLEILRNNSSLQKL